MRLYCTVSMYPFLFWRWRCKNAILINQSIFFRSRFVCFLTCKERDFSRSVMYFTWKNRFSWAVTWRCRMRRRWKVRLWIVPSFIHSTNGLPKLGAVKIISRKATAQNTTSANEIMISATRMEMPAFWPWSLFLYFCSLFQLVFCIKDFHTIHYSIPCMTNLLQKALVLPLHSWKNKGFFRSYILYYSLTPAWGSSWYQKADFVLFRNGFVTLCWCPSWLFLFWLLIFT